MGIILAMIDAIFPIAFCLLRSSFARATFRSLLVLFRWYPSRRCSERNSLARAAIDDVIIPIAFVILAIIAFLTIVIVIIIVTIFTFLFNLILKLIISLIIDDAKTISKFCLFNSNTP